MDAQEWYCCCPNLNNCPYCLSLLCWESKQGSKFSQSIWIANHLIMEQVKVHDPDPHCTSDTHSQSWTYERTTFLCMTSYPVSTDPIYILPLFGIKKLSIFANDNLIPEWNRTKISVVNYMQNRIQRITSWLMSLEASYFDRINMTENWLEYDRKNITPTNMNVGTWPKDYTNEHDQLHMTEIPMKMTEFENALNSLRFRGVGRWCRWCVVLVSWRDIRWVWLPMTLSFFF